MGPPIAHPGTLRELIYGINWDTVECVFALWGMVALVVVLVFFAGAFWYQVDKEMEKKK